MSKTTSVLHSAMLVEGKMCGRSRKRCVGQAVSEETARACRASVSRENFMGAHLTMSNQYTLLLAPHSVEKDAYSNDMRPQYHSLTAILLVVVGLLQAKLAVADDRHKFCELWSAKKDDEFDLVAVTDDTNYGIGREEDMALVRAFRKLGRKATRISIQDDDFDWTSTKMVVIRSAWDKYQYYEYYNEFQQEINDIAILMNPLKILQWQANKAKYLDRIERCWDQYHRNCSVKPRRSRGRWQELEY